MTDQDYMGLALELAERGRGYVNPNPMVGAVVVKDGRIIGKGYHQRYGELHAERNALADCSESAEGATIYVTLEPCCHYGKTPPCTDAIIENKIARVVVGSSDPNPLVAGKGIRILREHGIQVDEHVREAECLALNRVFFHYIQNGTPYVVMKYAMTLDGKIATVTGASRWITGEAARERVHESRHAYRSIMAGVGTVLADDPMLNCRLPGRRSPVRIVCDTHLRTPPAAQLVRTAGEYETILATSCADEAAAAPYREAGCKVLVLPEENGHICLPELMRQVGKEGIDSILLEGGGTLNWSMLSAGLVHRVQAYVSPKLFGGREAPGPVGGAGVSLPAEAVYLTNLQITPVGEDLCIEGEVVPCSPES